jgi:spore coat-associated protein N
MPISRLLSLAAMCAVAVVCAGAGATRPSEPAQAVLTGATGDLQVTNSRDGQAIFQAGGLAPGRSVTGTVELKNSGSLPGDLSLQQLDVQDTPGANGGRLSNAVQLEIADVTSGNPTPIFNGQLGGLGSRPLGSIGPGGSRIFRFVASLPDGGSPSGPTAGDNAYAGSGLTVRYAWTATSTGTGPGPSENVAPVVQVKINSKTLLKRGYIDVLPTCNIACRVSAYAQLPKAKKKAKKAPKTRTLTTTLTPNTQGRIRLKVSRKAKRQLAKTLKKKRRVVVQVRLSVSRADGGTATAYTRKASIKKANRKLKRRR